MERGGGRAGGAARCGDPLPPGPVRPSAGPARCPPGPRLTSSVPGVFATSTRDREGGRALHVLNITGYRPEVRIVLDGEELLLRPAPHTGYLLARGLELGGVRILEANAEVTEAGDSVLAFGAPPAADRLRVVLESSTPVRAEGPAAEVRPEAEGRTVVTADGPVRVHLG